MANTKTVVKPKAKSVVKPKAKVVAKPATLVYAAILTDALGGKFGAFIQRFYVNAITYHAKQQTTFPRGRIANVPLMSADDAVKFIEARQNTSIPAGSLPAQRLFDQMMVESKQIKAA